MSNNSKSASVFVALAFASACGGSTPQSTPVQSPTIVAASPVEKVPTKTHAVVAATKVEFWSPLILGHIGKERTMLLSVDWGLLQHSPFYALFETLILDSGSRSASLAKIASTCHFAPLEVLSTATLAWGDSLDMDDALIVATGNLTQAELEQCAGKLSDSDGRKKLREWYWPEDGVALITESSRAAQLESEVDQGSVLDNAEMMVVMQNIRGPLNAVWGAGVLSHQVKQLITGGGMGMVAPEVFFLTVNVEEGLDASLTLQFSSAAEADQVLTMVKGVMPMLKMQATGPYTPLANAIAISGHDSNLTIDLILTRVETEDFISALFP